MNTTTANHLSAAEAWLIITILAYFMMNGAQLFETFVIVPKWTASPPESLQLFKGSYGLDLKTFWITCHVIHEITFILAIVYCWKLPFVRNWMLILFLVHFAVRVWTLTYFAPNIIEFQKIANSSGTGDGLLRRVLAWKALNYLRVAIFIAISVGQAMLWLKAFRLK